MRTRKSKHTQRPRGSPAHWASSDWDDWREAARDTDGSEGFHTILTCLIILFLIGIFGILIPYITLIPPIHPIELIAGGISFLFGMVLPVALLVFFVTLLFRENIKKKKSVNGYRSTETSRSPMKLSLIQQPVYTTKRPDHAA